MDITFTCPNCGEVTLIGQEFVGQSGPCRACDCVVTVPNVSSSTAQRDATGPANSGPARHFLSFTIIEVMVAMVIFGLLAFMLAPAVVNKRTRRGRMGVMNQLKQIGLAMHNYHDVYHSLPRAYYIDDQGRRTNSWRVQLLPFLEEEEAFEEYQDSESMTVAKRDLLRKKLAHHFNDPDIGTWHPEHTSFMVITGPGTMFEEGKDFTFADCKDGTSNTILAVEVKKSGVKWDDPVDLDIRSMVMKINASDRNGLGSPKRKGACVVFVDGSVRFLSNDVLESTLRAMITRDGGEKFDIP